ncbi:hypothetical protein [Desulfoluna spongiiphila]|uniref:Linear amide C-N hydrolases, choloylglycine hydrolase family n=1 Tax=Desulfoluna spongiiphila TaxID=419481 RepID=A0A1G5HX58_9BACT|nr:hypothetical protein [Desulfoluna spongiiphila]SCY68304.1 hypothetical protein SAMN05216233_11650 [Desulfoluna spongiiphila]
MKLKISLLSVLFVFCWVPLACACTGFAVYGEQIVYGMNFDYFSIPLKFLIESRGGMNVFHLAFLYEKTQDDPRFRNYYAKTCGMNDRGLFCSCQEVEPYVQGLESLGEGEGDIGDQYDALETCTCVDDVRRLIPSTRWVQSPGPSVHNLFADTGGHAMVTETDNRDHVITDMGGDFLVMANFPNHAMAGKPLDEVVGVGAERYRRAHTYLAAHKQSFGVSQGFDLLGQVVCDDPGCTTLCSMVCLPRERTIYLTTDPKMEKIWKVSLGRNVIETDRGYAASIQHPLGHEGILAADLESMACP